MDYTFTEKETEMMFNWGYTSEIEHGFGRTKNVR